MYFWRTFVTQKSDMSMGESISHNGIVEQIDKEIVYVRIVQQSACAGCHARGLCTVSEQKEKTIEIPDHSGHFSVGEAVEITGSNSIGMEAVVLAFVIPLIIVFTVIITGSILQWSETVTGLAALLCMTPYYLLLYHLRDKLKKRFVFTLKKLN